MAKAKQEESIEMQLWKAAEYKHVVMGLVFLKYISDSFEELYNSLKAEEKMGADPEDRDEYKSENVFFVPQQARWSNLVSNAKLPNIGKVVDEAMNAIEKENNSLKSVLPKVFVRDNLDSKSLGGLINLVLTPWQYVGLEEVDDEFDFKERFEHLQKELKGQMKQEQELNKRINENLAKVLIDG